MIGTSDAPRSEVLLAGLAALTKCAVLVAGVPLAVLRLWMLVPGPRAPLAPPAWEGVRAGGHGALAAVCAIWLVVAGRLARDLARALTGHLGPTTGSWSTRWAARVAGLLLLASAGSVATAGIAAATAVHATAAPAGAAAPAGTIPPAGSASSSGSAGDRSSSEAPRGDHTHLYLVEPGDCLASIAARELGNAGDWPAIARLNVGRLQPDGRRMTDPSLIFPGWVLVLPAPQSASAGPVVGVAPALPDGGSSATRVVPAGAVARPAPAWDPAERPRRPVARAARPGTGIAAPALPAAPTRHLDELGILGIGLLGAAGVARRLRSRRRARECLRHPGERVARPARTTGTAAALLEPLADAELLDWVDVANRLLWRGYRLRAGESPAAPLPEIRRVRVGPDGVDFELRAPVDDAVEGFTARDDGQVWSLDTSAGLGALARLAEGCGRYVPALVPVGDADDASYLVALGPGRRLAIDAAPAPGPASDMPSGTPSEPGHRLPGGTETQDSPGQRRAVESAALMGILVALAAVPWSDELQVEIAGNALAAGTTRLLGLNTSSAAELAELARDPATTHHGRLASTWSSELVVVVGASSAGGGRVGLDAALLDSVGRRAGIVSLGGPATDRLVVRGDSLLLEPGGIELRCACPTTAQLTLLGDLLEESEADPLPAADTPSGGPSQPAAAGPVEVRLLRRAPDVAGWVAEPPGKDRARIVELLAYLALHGHAASGDRIRSAVFSRGDRSATLGRVHNVCSAARRVLGTAAEGHSYLPAATGGQYRLDPAVTTDWARFEQRRLLALDAEPTTAVSLLTGALEMLEGPPLADVPCGWDWMLAEGILATVVAAIVDAAHHCATLGLAAGDTALARWAIAKGRLVEPWSETLARDTMALADAEGDRDGVRRAWRDLEGALDRLEGNEPSAETRALFESLVAQRR